MDVDGSASAAFRRFRIRFPVRPDFSAGSGLSKFSPSPCGFWPCCWKGPVRSVSREHLRTRIWGDSTFVEFDQGLNYCIRQIRLALRDGAAKPAVH